MISSLMSRIRGRGAGAGTRWPPHHPMTDVVADFEHKAQDGLLILKLVNRDRHRAVALAVANDPADPVIVELDLATVRLLAQDMNFLADLAGL